MDNFEFYLAREQNKQDAQDSARIMRQHKRQMTREERKIQSTESMIKFAAVCFALIIALGILAAVLDL